MLVADDDDNMLEREAEEKARGYSAEEPMEAESSLDLDPPEDDEHFQILPLVLQMLEAYTAGGDGGRLETLMSGIRAKLWRCETFLADLEQKALSDDPNDERQMRELLDKRSDLFREHTRRRLPPSAMEISS